MRNITKKDIRYVGFEEADEHTSEACFLFDVPLLFEGGEGVYVFQKTFPARVALYEVEFGDNGEPNSWKEMLSLAKGVLLERVREFYKS